MVIKNLMDFKKNLKIGTNLKTTRTKQKGNDIVDQEVLLRSVNKIIKEGFSLATLRNNKIMDAYVFYPKNIEIINGNVIRIKDYYKEHQITFDMEIIE